MYLAGLIVGRMTRTIWVTFLMGQAGLIRKLNYLDVTQIFNRSHVLKKTALASGKWVNLCLVNVLNHCWCYYPSCFEACGVQRFYFQEVHVWVQFCILQEWRNLSYQNFYMSFCITFQKKTSACGSYLGHIRIALWVKWVNRCDPLSTLMVILLHHHHHYRINSEEISY